MGGASTSFPVVYRIVVLICTGGSSILAGTSLCMADFEISCFRRLVLP